jgi:hypothetical protein
MSEHLMKRSKKADVRIIRRALTVSSAAEAIGPIEAGCEIYGLTKGQFSLIDVIEHILSFSGADITFAYSLMSCGLLTSLRFLVDFSFPSRQPAYCVALRETFGDDCIRVSKNHAKFVLLRNDFWNIVVRTSMNLNENRRLENFEISDDRKLADFLESVIDSLFDAQPAEKHLDRRPIAHITDFEKLGGEVVESGRNVMSSADTKRFYNDGPFENDLRRVGLTYVR